MSPDQTGVSLGVCWQVVTAGASAALHKIGPRQQKAAETSAAFRICIFPRLTADQECPYLRGTALLPCLAAQRRNRPDAHQVSSVLKGILQRRRQ